ncbi:AraC family transcriptional regulator [Ottowia thiooxydans]|uniref:AraC family transcriptional regulator n=1 Tax=Ottowia thiooxydans TaxID=219182 RepID=UPI001B7FAAC2|nr:AraC family transcriptional regulator [Ottowia thiooxydans]
MFCPILQIFKDGGKWLRTDPLNIPLFSGSAGVLIKFEIISTCSILLGEQSSCDTPDMGMNKADDTFGELAALVSRHAGRTHGPSNCAIDGLHFGWGASPTSPMQLSQWPCLAMVVQGQKSVGIGDEVYFYGVGDYLIVSLDLPVVSAVTKASPSSPYLGLGMAINPVRVKEVMGRMPGLAGVRQRSPLRSVSVHQASQELLDAVLRLLHLIDSPDDIAALAPLMEQEILYRVLQGPAGPQLLDIALSESPGNRIYRAVSWLQENYMRPLRMQELARFVGMSVSSLHHRFKEMTAMTPLQYQKQVRLHEAHRLMLVERLDVGSAGFAVGYQSQSHFSREYSRHFGAPPFRHLAESRQLARVAKPET